MRYRLVTSAVMVAATLALLTAPIAGADPDHGNSAAAHLCQQGGYLSLVGSDGTTFKNVGQCVRHAAHGGTFAEGIIIPAGEVATLSNAQWRLGPCDALTYGYELNLGADVPLASKPPGCFNAAVPGAVIGPFPTATLLRIFLRDTGFPPSGAVCDHTFYSDGSHALVTGSNPYIVDIRDSFFCVFGPNDPFPPTGVGQGNINVTVTIS